MITFSFEDLLLLLQSQDPRKTSEIQENIQQAITYSSPKRNIFEQKEDCSNLTGHLYIYLFLHTLPSFL